MPKPIRMEENDLSTVPNQNQELDDLLADLTTLEKLKLFKEMEKRDLDIDGEGIKDVIRNLKKLREGVKEAFKGVRMNFPPSSRAVLEKYGDAEIEKGSIKVCRKPLEKGLQKVIKAVARKPFYDEIFHLSIRFKIKGGPVVRLDKRETLQAAVDDDQVNTECRPVQASEKTPNTLNQILANTKARMGDRRFYTYSSTENNCQIYVLNVMAANGIRGHEDFIKQNVNELIPKFFGKLSDIGTDIKSRLSFLTEGKGIPEGVHPLTMKEINEYYSNKPFYQGTYMSNALPQKIKTGGAMIINLEDIETNGSGTHWVCCLRKGRTNFYFDSYGLPCDDDVMKMFQNSGGKSLYNDSQLQKLDTVTCGYYCVYMIDKVMEEGQPINKALKSLTQKPSKSNENKVVDYVENQ